MLAKGLSCSLEPTMEPSHHFTTKLGPGDIDLAHAHAKQQCRPDESTRMRGFIPNPTTIPSAKKRKLVEDAHTSSSDLGLKSQILDNLDTCERKS